MKKVLALLVLLLLVGCSPKIDGGSLKDIKERGYIVIATEGLWSPWTYHDKETDKLVGYDVEIGKYIADYLGVEARYEEADFDALLAGADAGRYDMVINGVDVTPDRQEAYSFSDGYAYDKICVIVLADNDDINEMEDLKGKNTANTINSSYAKIAKKYGAQVTGAKDFNDTLQLLDRGSIDATINSKMSFDDYIAETNSDKYKIACFNPESNPIAIAMKKGSSDLVNEVNKALTAARKDKTLHDLSIKYFGEDITIPTVKE